MSNLFPGPTTLDIDNELKALDTDDLERLARVDVPATNWHSLTPEQQRSQRARNELAKRRRIAAEQAQAAQAQQELQQRRDEQNAATVEQFKQAAFLSFPGTRAEFEHEWPAIKAAYQRQQALNAMSAAERKAQSGLYNFRPD